MIPCISFICFIAAYSTHHLCNRILPSVAWQTFMKPLTHCYVQHLMFQSYNLFTESKEIISGLSTNVVNFLHTRFINVCFSELRGIWVRRFFSLSYLAAPSLTVTIYASLMCFWHPVNYRICRNFPQGLNWFLFCTQGPKSMAQHRNVMFNKSDVNATDSGVL